MAELSCKGKSDQAKIAMIHHHLSREKLDAVVPLMDELDQYQGILRTKELLEEQTLFSKSWRSIEKTKIVGNLVPCFVPRYCWDCVVF